jgi:hypothetical protein
LKRTLNATQALGLKPFLIRQAKLMLVSVMNILKMNKILEVQPYPSWTWANKVWNPPTPMPTDGKMMGGWSDSYGCKVDGCFG